MAYLSFLLEEVLHELAALFLEDAAGDAASGVQGAGSVVGIASFLVAAAIDDAWYLAPAEGTGTHGAGLYGDVEGAVGQIFASQLIGCSGNGLHLGMGCHVVQRLRQVVGTGYDAVLTDHHGADRYLALLKGLLCLY